MVAHFAFSHLSYVADSWGRGLDNPGVIKVGLAEIRTDVSEKMVEKWMAEWEAAGMIVRYEVGRRKYYQIIHFDQFQPDTVRNRRKAKGSAFPSPPAGELRQESAGASPTSAGEVRQRVGSSTPPEGSVTERREQNAENRTQNAEGGARRPSDPLLLPFQITFPGQTPWAGSRRYLDEWRAIADDRTIIELLEAAKGTARLPAWITAVLPSVVKIGSVAAWIELEKPSGKSKSPVDQPYCAAHHSKGETLVQQMQSMGLADADGNLIEPAPKASRP